MCVGNDNDVNQDKGIMCYIPEKVDQASAKINCYCKNTKNVNFMDAPVSGGQKNGQLTIMVGGDENIYNEIQPLLMSYATTLIGKTGTN